MCVFRDKQATNAGSGPEFFGFSHPTILNLIQNMEDAEMCTKYKRMSFQQPLSRGKQPGVGARTGRKGGNAQKLGATSSKEKAEKSGDPSLAPVMVNRQLSSHLQNSSSDLSYDSDSDIDLLLDAILDAR